MKSAGAAILIGLVLSTLAVGCGGGTSNADKTATAAARGGANPTTVATKAISGSPASSGTRKQLTITAKDFSFSADSVNVAKGDAIAITFKNSGSATHTLTFYSDAAYANAIAGGDTGNVSAGATATLTVTADVGLFYRCNIHPAQMQGQIDFR